MLMPFEELPGNVQALILAKLAAEMKVAKANSIYHLAHIRRSNIGDLWRTICCKAGQPVCTIPVGVQQRT